MCGAYIVKVELCSKRGQDTAWYACTLLPDCLLCWSLPPMPRYCSGPLCSSHSIACPRYQLLRRSAQTPSLWCVSRASLLAILIKTICHHWTPRTPTCPDASDTMDMDMLQWCLLALNILDTLHSNRRQKGATTLRLSWPVCWVWQSDLAVWPLSINRSAFW